MARRISHPPTILQGTLDMMILKTLEAGAYHGYGIMRRIRQRSGEVFIIEEGTLYPALHRLAKRGYLESEWGASEANRRAKFYRLTPAGRRQLKAERSNWQSMARAIGKVMNARSRPEAIA